MRSPRATIGRRLHQWVWECPDDATFAARFRLANRRWRLPIDLSYDPAAQLFHVESDGSMVAVARRSRLEYYLSGAQAREQQLIDEYFLRDVPLSAGDVVIDVGANIGEVSLLLARRHATIPLAFEPSGPEFRALEVNLAAAGGQAWNEVLWSAQETVTFHDANDTGDSSVFAPPGASVPEVRRATTLDAALADSEYRDIPVRLLKLEAEGAEPEILEGATTTLERVEHVVADLGPERGVAGESTLASVSELLQAHGFARRRIGSKRMVVHFAR